MKPKYGNKKVTYKGKTFDSVKEKEIFLKLIGVSGVGPKMGIAVLTTLSADEFAQVIATADDAWDDFEDNEEYWDDY